MKFPWLRGLSGLFVLLLSLGAAQAQDAKFNVFEFRVEGVKLLPAPDVEKAVYPFMGENKTLADVEKAREALEKVYHGQGFLTVLVTIPQQRVNEGVVRLQVTEAPVERLRVVDANFFSPQDMKDAVPELAEGRVPNFTDMQAELMAVNRNPDRRVSPVLRPGKTPGTVDVDLKVQDRRPFHGGVELNDRYSPDTTRSRLTATARWDNLWGKQHSIGVAVQTAPENTDESRVFSLNYAIPLRGGDVMALYGVKTDSDVAAVGTLNVVGRGTVLGLRYIKPLRSSEEFFQSASFGVDHKDFDQAVNLIGSGGFNTPIRYMPFTLGWDGTWLDDKRKTTRVGLAANFHVQGLVGSEQEFADKRYKGRPSYLYLRGHLTQERNYDSGYSLKLRAQWQLAGQALISNEQFAIGGADTVRGYLESAALGERGLALSAEALSPNLFRLFSKADEPTTQWRALAFVDAGQVRVIDPLIDEQDRFTLSSVGLGLRLTAANGLRGELVWAYPLKAINNTARGDHRLHLNIAYDW
jgi:hemolysin activation/secretion protein